MPRNSPILKVLYSIDSAKILLLSLFYFSSLVLPNLLFAQPFSTIDVGYTFSKANQLDERYFERYQLSDQQSISLTVPYYFGNLVGRVDKMDYKRISDSTNYESLNFSLGLSLIYRLLNIIFFIPEGNFGIQKMQLGNTSDSVERELFIGQRLKLGVSIKNINIFYSFEHRRIFNYQRQSIIFNGLGISVKLKLPTKVQDVIS
jgi:hypothetical protein